MGRAAEARHGFYDNGRSRIRSPVKLGMRRNRVWTLLLVGVAYLVANMGTAMLAGMAASPAAVKGWRITAWLLSLAIFGIHFASERRRHERRLRVAAYVALAVAIGAFAVAAVGPLRGHWSEPSRLKLVLLSVVAWPVFTGVPAFVVALIAGFILDRAASGGPHFSSRVA